ncbi:SHOCT domain-containing protein [Halopenitus persicus]|uniref:hypothetical protein n=1 Tax=Halopenitus persicus TaxID=1048396 RepID=UPI0012FDA2F0|nr:hypothetical protein [Halopenitus persicus]
MSEQTQLTEFAEEAREQDAASVEEIRERYAEGEIGDRELEEQLERAVGEPDVDGGEDDEGDVPVVMFALAFVMLLMVGVVVTFGVPLALATFTSLSFPVSWGLWIGAVVAFLLD